MNAKLLFVILALSTIAGVAEKKSKNVSPPVYRVVGTADQIIQAHQAGIKNISYDPNLAPVVPPKKRDTKVYDYDTQWSTNYWTTTSDGQRAIVMLARDGSATTVLQPKGSMFPAPQTYQPPQEQPAQQATYVQPQVQYVQPQVQYVQPQVHYVQPVYVPVYRAPRYSTYSYSYRSYGGYQQPYHRPYYGGCWEQPRYHSTYTRISVGGGFRARF